MATAAAALIGTLTTSPAPASALVPGLSPQSFINLYATGTNVPQRWLAVGSVRAGSCFARYELVVIKDASNITRLDGVGYAHNADGTNAPGCGAIGLGLVTYRANGTVLDAAGPIGPNGDGLATTANGGGLSNLPSVDGYQGTNIPNSGWANIASFSAQLVVCDTAGTWTALQINGPVAPTNANSLNTLRAGGTFAGNDCTATGQPYRYPGGSRWTTITDAGTAVVPMPVSPGVGPNFTSGADQVETNPAGSYTNAISPAGGIGPVTYGSNFTGTGWLQAWNSGATLNIGGISTNANRRHFQLAMTNPFGSRGNAQGFNVQCNDGNPAQTAYVPYTPQADWTNWAQGVVMVGFDCYFPTAITHTLAISRLAGGSGANLDMMRYTSNGL